MQKLTVILFGLLLGWCCGTGVRASEADSCDSRVVADSSISLPSHDELRCARTCNFDLNLPQSVVVGPVRTIAVQTMPCPERLGVKCGVSCGRCGKRVDCLSEFTRNLLIAGTGPVDYYVYRLCRLLI